MILISIEPPPLTQEKHEDSVSDVRSRPRSAPALELISRAASNVDVMYRSSVPTTGSNPGGGRILKKNPVISLDKPFLNVGIPSRVHLFDHLLRYTHYNYNFFKLLHVHGDRTTTLLGQVTIKTVLFDSLSLPRFELRTPTMI